MLKRFVLNHSDRYIARWLIFIIDLFLVAAAYVFAVLMRFNFDVIAAEISRSFEKLAIVLFFYAIGFFISRSYVGIVRHTNLRDAVNIVKAASFALVSILGLSFIDASATVRDSIIYVPRSVALIHFFASLFVLVGFRLGVKYFYELIATSKRVRYTRVLVFGAGASGLTTMQTLHQDGMRRLEVIAFIDDNPYKVGKAMGGVQVHRPSQVFNEKFIEKHRPDQLVISIQKALTSKRKKEIVEMALEFGLQIKIVPPFENWIQGELSAKQIKPLRIEDLLEREPIVLDNVNISREIEGKTVMVTGAAGSIGSEIARQLLHYKPNMVVLLDQAESALYDLESEFKRMQPDKLDLCQFVIGDVSNASRVRRVFEAYEPQIVFHAAAYKHVPMMENNPSEAVHVNIFGTKIVADFAVEFGVEKFVLVSTDKAVNPTNVMGATKRCAEMYTQSLGRKSGAATQFIITRFGNVLGSNGSVIPIFKRQIDEGGPLTITDKNITRFFMTIPEACNLVLEAGSMGKGGEVFVFDMGESVRIYDLAKKMIKLSGLELDKDIEIVEIGLRPGEKLYEELLAVKENTKHTYHPQIMIAESEALEYAYVIERLGDLEGCLGNSDNLALVRAIKDWVPEFISNNSIFASLDIKKIVNE